MTLLLNLIGPSGVHLSSDYRLTNDKTHKTAEDRLGSKQVSFIFGRWHSVISFTGTAEIGGRKTRDWILEALETASKSESFDKIVEALAARATREILRWSPQYRLLTIVVAMIEAANSPRLFVLTCDDTLNTVPPPKKEGILKIYEFQGPKPRALILGYKQAVTHGDRKLLKKLSVATHDPAEIRAAVARINARSAKRSDGWISEGCLVTTLFDNGTSASENYGHIPGLPTDVVGPDVKQLLSNILPKDQIPAFVQSRGAIGTNSNQISAPPMNVTKGNTIVARNLGEAPALCMTDSQGNTFTHMPRGNWADYKTESIKSQQSGVGESRRFHFSSPRVGTCLRIKESQRVIGRLMLGAVVGNLTVVKNVWTKGVLQSVSLEIEEGAMAESAPRSMMFRVSAVPTIDGIQPREWDYTIDVRIEGGVVSFSIRRNAVAFRSVNYAMPMGLIDDSEELVMFAPVASTLMTVSSTQPRADGVIEAAFLIRGVR